MLRLSPAPASRARPRSAHGDARALLRDPTGPAEVPRARSGSMLRRGATAAAVACVLLLMLPERPSAHEVPASVTVHGFVSHDADRIRLLIRVPLESMRDIEIPLRGPGYLDITKVMPLLHEAATIWLAGYVTMYADDVALEQGNVATARISLPSDASFREYGSALAHVRSPSLDPAVDLPWQQALLDVLIEFPMAAPGADLSIEPAFAHLGVRTRTVLRFVSQQGVERAYTYDGNPGIVRLDPRWHHAVLRFVKLGFLHILGGLDHILFVLCLVIPFRRFGPLLGVVTSFTVAHSITLIASVLGLAPGALWFPPLIETLIALSIVYMAFENIVGARLERRWLFAFGFGLVHGFGFSFLLRDSLQFAGSHLAMSLLAFNAGVELGQIAVLIIAIPALALLFRHVVAERIGTILLSALVAHTAWHWMTERGADLLQYDVTMPAFDARFAAGAVRVMMLALVAAMALRALHELVKRLSRRPAHMAGQPEA